MEFMFKIGDLIKDRTTTEKRYIKCARVLEKKINWDAHGAVGLRVYDSSTGRMENIWMDQYRFRRMTDQEVESYCDMIEKIDKSMEIEVLNRETFECEKPILLDYFKPIDKHKVLY